MEPSQEVPSYSIPNRSTFTTLDAVTELWHQLGLPSAALASLHLPTTGTTFPSSFKVSQLAQTSIALSALAAALIYSSRSSSTIPQVTVPLDHACAEFCSERWLRIDDDLPPTLPNPLAGFHKTADGYVRIHSAFPHHAAAALSLLGLPSNEDPTPVALAAALQEWSATDLEAAAPAHGAVIFALRTSAEWDILPQALALPPFPITIRKISSSAPKQLYPAPQRPLSSLRVLDFSRIIAAPIATRTLAAHGASVLWITAAHLPAQPSLDADTTRGKRSARLNLRTASDASQLRTLLAAADVFVQAYRPGSLAARGFGAADMAEKYPGLICAQLSAFGGEGSWSGRRGFDSMVQTCSGINAAEARARGNGEPGRELPCQALDHAAGYFLAAGVAAAVWRRAREGGSWVVEVSLAGTAKYLKSLGRVEDGFEIPRVFVREDVEGWLEEGMSGYGKLSVLKHSAGIEGVRTGWDFMSRKIGSDKAEWW